jgi:alpha-amylase/alpha-mannosidase (GH57 family)
MERFICVHGHFYQPPRENPWLESVELQDSASPYHDWNERITAECYAPNASARILNGEGKIEHITNNYSKISFNFGPTLLAWMKDKLPQVHEAIVEADRISQKRFSGHGSAVAQAYNHMILPLANTRDKFTQVFWGIRDFESRFGRMPEGLWLAETAADTETLDTLAQLGVKYTVLSPFQARRYREFGKKNWRDANGARIDPSRPYLMKLKEGRSITLFFYDAPVSQAIAFERLLTSGETFGKKLVSAFDDSRPWDQLVHIATDGESYGHHHKHGEMALAYALKYIEDNKLAKLTNYGEYLEKHPPTQEVQIHEKSAWSCSHGVGRWMADCGCNSGGHSGWNQGWRAPLRNALDWLRDELAVLFETKTREYLNDPWMARNDYIRVILNRDPEHRDAYFKQHAKRDLSEGEKVTVLKLMELQRHAMLMYTSCGWFFDELSGLETVQVIQYAGRTLQLARELFDRDFEPGFLDRMEAAKSNIPENRDGRTIYEKFVKPAMVDWPKAVAHYAISSLFQNYADHTRIFSFRVHDEDRHLTQSGKTRLVVGRTRMVSEITQESDILSYAILYMGEHNLTGGVRKFETAEAYLAMLNEIKGAYKSANFPETIRAIDRHFGHSAYSLGSLFKDEQRRILNEILASTRDDLENRFRLITERYEPLMKFLQTSGVPLPAALQSASDFVLHADLWKQIQAENLDFERLGNILQEARTRVGRVLDDDIRYAFMTRMEKMIKELPAHQEDIHRVRSLAQIAELAMPLSLGLDVWRVQNSYWEILQKQVPEIRARAEQGDEKAVEWINEFALLGERVGFAVPNLRVAAKMQMAA